MEQDLMEVSFAYLTGAGSANGGTYGVQCEKCLRQWEVSLSEEEAQQALDRHIAEVHVGRGTIVVPV